MKGLRVFEWVICRDNGGHLVLAQAMGFSVSDKGEHFVRVSEDDGERYSVPEKDVLQVVELKLEAE